MSGEITRLNDSLQAALAEISRIDKERLQLLERLAHAEEEERRRISLDLHDHCGQLLTLLRLQARRIRALCSDTRLADQLSELETTVVRLDGDIHHFIFELRPLASEAMTFLSVLASYIRGWSASVGIPVEMRFVETTECDLLAPQKVAIQRIAQEVLTNVAKHGEASKVIVTVDRTEHDLTFTIEDNGKGFETGPSAVVGRGVGLLGIHERAELVGARVDVRSGRGLGTSVTICVPLRPHAPVGRQRN